MKIIRLVAVLSLAAAAVGGMHPALGSVPHHRKVTVLPPVDVLPHGTTSARAGSA